MPSVPPDLSPTPTITHPAPPPANTAGTAEPAPDATPRPSVRDAVAGHLAAAGIGPNTDRLCRECGTNWTDDPGRMCSECLPDAAARVPGSISQDQRRQIATLLLAREPVARVESITSFMTAVLGRPFGPTSTLWELSAKEGGDVLEALRAEALGGIGLRGIMYEGKRHAGAPERRPARGAHRARG